MELGGGGSETFLEGSVDRVIYRDYIVNRRFFIFTVVWPVHGFLKFFCFNFFFFFFARVPSRSKRVDFLLQKLKKKKKNHTFKPFLALFWC